LVIDSVDKSLYPVVYVCMLLISLVLVF